MPLAIYYASEGKTDELRKELEKHPAAISIRSKYSDSTPLHFAAVKGHLETVKLLLEYGANIYEGQYTAFYDVINKLRKLDDLEEIEKRMAIVDLLLRYEAEMRGKNPDKFRDEPFLKDRGASLSILHNKPQLQQRVNSVIQQHQTNRFVHTSLPLAIPEPKSTHFQSSINTDQSQQIFFWQAFKNLLNTENPPEEKEPLLSLQQKKNQ